MAHASTDTPERLTRPANAPECPRCHKLPVFRTTFGPEGSHHFVTCQHCSASVLLFAEDTFVVSVLVDRDAVKQHQAMLREITACAIQLRRHTGKRNDPLPTQAGSAAGAGGRPAKEDRARTLLEVLTLDRFANAGASASAWQALAGDRGVPERTFFYYLPKVTGVGWVQKSNGKPPRYRLTPAGVLQLTATAITVSAVAVDHRGEAAA